MNYKNELLLKKRKLQKEILLLDKWVYDTDNLKDLHWHKKHHDLTLKRIDLMTVKSRIKHLCSTAYMPTTNVILTTQNNN